MNNLRKDAKKKRRLKRQEVLTNKLAKIHGGLLLDNRAMAEALRDAQTLIEELVKQIPSKEVESV